MKNKNLFFVIYIAFLIIIIVSILILYFLGTKERIGYLSDFNLNIDRTLELNGLTHIKENYIINNKLDEESLKDYIIINEVITNYSYDFRIKYYSKIFRNSDIYGVYTDTNKIIQSNNFIKEIKFDYKGSPFGILTSTKELNPNDKIDNIHYKLNIKLNIFILIIFAYLFIFAISILIIDKNKRKFILQYFDTINCFFIKYRKYILLILYSFILILFILFIIINSSIKHTPKLTNLELITESEAGYVYKAKINEKDNFLFSINNNSIQLNNTNNIKYYGYSLEITNKPLGSWHSTNIYYTKNNTFIISNESTNVNAYYYNIQVPTFIGDKYKITILAKQLPEEGSIFWHLNGNNNFKEIFNKNISNNYIVLTDTREIDNIAGGVLDLHLIIPQGVTEIESIKIESLNTNLNSENGYIFLTLNKEANDLTIRYYYKYNDIFYLFLLLLLLVIVYYIEKLLNRFNKYTLIENNNSITNTIFISKNVENIIFILFILIISVFLLSFGFLKQIKFDDFAYGTYYNGYYHIFDFKTNTWHRGRHFAEIMGVFSFRTCIQILSSFRVDPIISFHIVKSIITLFYSQITIVSMSIIIWILNKRRNYKVIYIAVSIYIIYITFKTINFIYFLFYIGLGGIALLLFIPYLLFFIEKKEVILGNHKVIYYTFLLFSTYAISFLVEPVSLFMAGLSFFILIYIIYDIRVNNSKINFYIIFNLIFIIITTIIAFILSYTGGRAEYQRKYNLGYSIYDNFINNYNNVFTNFDKIIFYIGIFIFISYIIHFINKKNVSKHHYIIFVTLLISILGIIGLFSINTQAVWFELLWLFCSLVLLLFYYINMNNIIKSFSACFILLFTIITLSISILQDYSKIFDAEKYNFKIYSEIRQQFENADKLNLAKVIIKDSIIKQYIVNNNVSGLISLWMYNYGYTKKIIKIEFED